MKYRMFTGQGSDIEKKISEWITPNIEISHLAQSSLVIPLADKNVPFTIVSIFYTERTVQDNRIVE
jgi:hypothetical protein